MSVVIAVKDKKTKCVYVGCDGQATSGNNKITLKGQSNKIWNHNGIDDLIIGGVGTLRDLQIIQCSPDIIEPMGLALGIDYSYMVRVFYTSIYNRLKEYNRIEISGEGVYSPFIQDSFIVVQQDEAWVLDPDGAVQELDDYLVIGSGQDIATGVLENNKNKDPRTRITEAILACSDKTVYVDDNITILHTPFMQDKVENGTKKGKTTKTEKVVDKKKKTTKKGK